MAKGKAKAPKGGLTARRMRFVKEYLISLNATAAYCKAGYSPRGAHKRATRLMANDGIQAAIAKAQRRRAIRTDVRQDDVVRELARVAFADVQSYVKITEDGIACRASDKWTEDESRAVKSISEKLTPLGRQISIVCHDKVRALELLLKHTAGDVGGDVTFNLNLTNVGPGPEDADNGGSENGGERGGGAL